MTPSRPFHRRFGLHTRVSLGVAAVVLAATVAIAMVALQLVRGSLRASITGEQFARVSSIATGVDQKFGSRRILLQTFVDSVEAQNFQDGRPLQAFLEQHKSLRLAFDNVAFLDLEGNLVANLSNASQVGTINIRDRAYFQQTVQSGLGLISRPYRNRLNGLAQVAITEPVLDAQGKVRFVVSGALNLKDRNILGDLADVRFGKTGYLFILTADGVVVDHPDAALILNRLPTENGANPEIRRAIAGFEGTSEGTDESGVRGLFAFQRTDQTNWIVGAMYPSDEAFAGALEARDRAPDLGVGAVLGRQQVQDERGVGMVHHHAVGRE
ncbi:cache domain-containing protein, partial [Variovorax sp. CT11-76]